MQLAKPTIGQRTQRNRTEGDAFKFDDLVAHTSEQAANFSIATFLQLQFQNSTASLVLDDSHTPKLEEALGKIHAFAELRQYFRCRPAGDMTAISSYDFKPRVSQSLSQIAVVGHQQQSGCILVQTADGEESLVGHRNQVDRSRSPVRISVGAQDAARFVQQKIAEPRQSQTLGIQTHITGLGVYGSSRVGDHFTVDCHSPVTNVLLAVASRVDSGHCEKLLQPHDAGIFGHGIFSGCIGGRSCRGHAARFRNSYRTRSRRTFGTPART